MQTTRPQPQYQAEATTPSWGSPVSLQPQQYELSFETTLKHSNATQNVYFSNFFEWQGATRERWFFECIAPDMLQSLGVFITKRAHNEFIKEAFPFQKVTCVLNSMQVQKCSFYLVFRFFIDGELASLGYQQIVFANHEKRISKLPDEVLKKVKRFEVSPASVNIDL
jgi:enediyne biosynthesis thioesterase